MSKKLIVTIIAVLGVCVLIASIGYYVYASYYLPSRVAPLPLSPQLQEFPSEEKQYPADWPVDFRFPEGFLLVDSTAGNLPESTGTAWSARLIYKGETSDAVRATTEFLVGTGWTVTENVPVDLDNTSLIVERGNGSGIIAISKDPNNSSQTLITATLFP
jgi:hypothetical protein